jgi:hypothetical protein
MPPVLKQPGRLGRDLPLAGIGQSAPTVHALAHLVDDGSRIVFLILVRKPLALVEHERGLFDLGFALFWLGDWGNEFGAAALIDDALGRLSSFV